MAHKYFLSQINYMSNIVLDKVLAGLMIRYKERVPDVQGVINTMIKEGVITNANEI
jgi:hypothetical protein